MEHTERERERERLTPPMPTNETLGSISGNPSNGNSIFKTYKHCSVFQCKKRE